MTAMSSTRMTTAMLLLLLVVLGSMRPATGYGEDDCLNEEHFQIEPNNFTLAPVSTILPKFTCANLSGLNTTTVYSSVLMQYHAWDCNITGSVYDSYNIQYSAMGAHLGVLAVLTGDYRSVQGYVTLSAPNTTTTEALVLFTPLSDSVPVPGMCNMESNPQNNPNLHISYEVRNVLVNVTFSEANVAFSPKKPPPACQGSAPAHNRLRYDFFIRFLPWNQYSKGSLFDELKKMMTVEGIKKHGHKIHTFGKNDKPELRLAMFNGRGVILNIVVRDSTNGKESAYVPAVTYACGDNNGSMCDGRVQPLPGVLFALLMIVGVFICFCGHRYFLAEIFFFGFLPFALLSFMILAANTALSQSVMLVLALVFGVPGGCIWLALWWRFGYILPIMMWVSFTLGYMLSSLVFFTPFGNLVVWYNSLAYGMAFMCGVMIVPVILIVFTKFLSMLACAVWGGYFLVAAVSYFSGGVLQYILLNIIHRASIPGYSEAIVVVPMNIIDYFLIAVWFVLIVSGVLVQRRLTRGRRDFPLCAYKENLLRRNQQNALRNQIRYQGTPQAPRRNMENPVADGLEDDDNAPLV